MVDFYSVPNEPTLDTFAIAKTFYGVPPAPSAAAPIQILSVIPTDEVTIRVTFVSAAANNAALVSPDSWEITPSLSVLSVTPEAVGSPTYVDLTIEEMLDAQAYTLELFIPHAAAAPVSVTGNFTGLGDKPSVVSVDATTTNTLRVVFDEAMEPILAGTAVNYTLVAAGGSVSRSVMGVRLANTVSPSWVDLVLDGEMTGGAANYTLTVSTALEDLAGNTLDAAGSVQAVNGRGDGPRIVNVRADPVDLTKVVVTFDEAVKAVSASNPDDALNLSNYGVTGGNRIVIVESATALSDRAIELGLIGQLPGTDYQITISNIEDLSNNAVV